METDIILNGHFSDPKKHKGNFVGYTKEGKRILIFKSTMRQMLGIGNNEDWVNFKIDNVGDIKLHVIYKENVEHKDETNRPFVIKVLGTAIFKTKEELDYALSANERQEIAVQEAYKEMLKNSGLSAISIARLLKENGL
jgi:hypothetical protein